MTTKRHHGPTGTDLAAALLIFIAGAAFGAVSTFVLGVKSTSPETPLVAQETTQQPVVQTGEPIEESDESSPDEPAVHAVYRGVVEKNDGASLQVAVMEGVVAPISVTLTVAGSAKITALVAANDTAASGGKRSSDGTLPPPLDPVASPYKEEPRRLSDFKAGDVVEFGAAAGIEDGATVEAGFLTWIFSNAPAAAPGPMGDSGTAPLQ